MDETVPETNHAFTEDFRSDPSEACWVFKLGGSLLSCPDLAPRLRAVIGQVSAKPLLVVGGGAAADVVRGWDETHQIPPSTVHWLAVRAMELNQRLLEALLPEAVVVSTPEQAAGAWEENGIALLHAWEWLQNEEVQPISLPHSWQVTSDSIAAWAAVRWSAEGLVLLKSLQAPDSEKSLSQFVDDYFPLLLPKLSQLAWCNFQAESLEIRPLEFLR